MFQELSIFSIIVRRSGDLHLSAKTAALESGGQQLLSQDDLVFVAVGQVLVRQHDRVQNHHLRGHRHVTA